MKTPIIAAMLLVLAVPADARMRHDRLCDIVQDKFDAFNPLYNPDHSKGVRFGKCEPLQDTDIPVGDSACIGCLWNALNCGYEAYRKGKKLTDGPYKNEQMTARWKEGWKYARKSCAENMFPTFEGIE